MKHFTGTVIKGLQNGRKIGFPTANVSVGQKEEIEDGIFAVEVDIENRSFRGMMYVGTRPSFNLTDKSIEVHIFDFSEDIYGKKIDIRIRKKVGSEQKFTNIDDLARKIQEYKTVISNYFLCEK